MLCIQYSSSLWQVNLFFSDDEETEDNTNVSETRGAMEEKLKLELANPMVGMKRTMSYEPYICSADEWEATIGYLNAPNILQEPSR